MSLDRFIAIKTSIRYRVHKQKFKFFLLFYYILIFSNSGSGMLTSFYNEDHHRCYDKFGFVDLYDYAKAITGYILPVLLIAYFNLNVIRKLQMQPKNLVNGGTIRSHDSRIIASRSLVKISLALGIAFIVSAAYANIFLILSTARVISISKESHFGELSILSSNICMSLNPILSIIFLPSLRRKLKRIFSTNRNSLVQNDRILMRPRDPNLSFTASIVQNSQSNIHSIETSNIFVG